MFKYSIYSSLEDGLINYWSFTNNVNDSIGTAHFYNGTNASLIHDRFGYNNSALRLNSGYYCVPPGVYFNGPFTTSIWVNAKSNGWSARVFDFGVNGWNSDNIVFSLFRDNSLTSFFEIYSQSYLYNWKSLDSNTDIVLNEWIHLAVTFDGSKASFYYNGIFSGSSPQYQPRNVIRSTNYIGKSNWPQDELANAVFDELRIYNRVLTQNEINSLMYF